MDVASIFKVQAHTITATSAEESFGLVALFEQVVNIPPNEKTFGLMREARKENVYLESQKEAERGIWKSIKAYAGKAYEFCQSNKKKLLAQLPRSQGG